jgi:hypothetical protein
VKDTLRRAALPAILFAACSLVYTVTLADRFSGPRADNHYVLLADSILHGQLGLMADRPPGYNDWACFDIEARGACPPNKWHFPGETDRYKWYVSFPPLPALVILPAVALFGVGMADALFWAILAGLSPALLFVLLRFLRESGRSERTLRDDLLLTALFAFGTVYYFTAVQGTVWFAAHVVAVPLITLFVLWGLGGRRPFLAGLMLGLALVTRPTVAFLAILFLLEVMNASRGEASVDPAASPLRSCLAWLRQVRWGSTLRRCALFAVPILAIGCAAMAVNAARFDDPFEFGHTFLQVRWRARIERWGLFNYHFFPKNLGIFLAGLPWLSAHAPFIKIGRHGLALWFTTPNLLVALWPKRRNPTLVALYLSMAIVAVLNLSYQNSGWIQFGYRFALDYMVLVFAALSLGGRRFGLSFRALAVFAIVVNLFGAITFDRAGAYYDDDDSQTRIFQPD